MAESHVLPGGEETLDSMLLREDKDIEAMLKQAGVDVGIETRPEPVESSDDLKLETPGEEEKPPEPEPTPEKKEEPPTPVPEPEQKEPETPPPAETKPPDRVSIWKALRDSERRQRELEAENQRLREQQRRAPPADELAAAEETLEQEDPLTKLQKQQELQAREQEQLREQLRQRDLTDQIVREETEFKKTHPEYDQALMHLAVRARERWTLTGELEEMALDVVKNHRDAIDKVLEWRRIANPSDDDVAKAADDIAFANKFQFERNQFVNRARSRGQNIAQAAWDFATHEGYQPTPVEPASNGNAPPAAPVPAKKNETAQERVQRQAKLALANQSLSAMQNAGSPRPLNVKSKSEFMQLRPEQQDALIEAMEEIDPDWHQKLPD